jgi:hypothetical protein
MDKKTQPNGPSRRKFLVGMLTGAGAATIAVASVGKGGEKAATSETPLSGPILYHRTAETERYYKTLYT